MVAMLLLVEKKYQGPVQIRTLVANCATGSECLRQVLKTLIENVE